MDGLLATLQKELARRNITQTELAKKMGVSVATVNNQLNGVYRMKFFYFVKLISCISDNYSQFERLIWEFLKELQDTKNKNNKLEIVREGLEWSLQNGNMQLLEYFINEDSKLTDNGELGKIYSLLAKRNQGLFKSLEFYDELETLKLHGYKRGESSVLLRISSIYALFESQSFNLFFHEIEKTMDLIERIKNKYLKKAYTMRIKEALAIAHMLKNELSVAQKLCEEILNDDDAEHFPLLVNSINLLMAQMNLFTDYEKSLEYLRKTLMLFQKPNFLKNAKRRLKRVEATHDFIKIVNKDFDGLFLTDRSEYAHFLAMQEEPELNKKALEILEELQKENGYLTPFQRFYKALALRNAHLMKEAEEEFLISGNRYYAQLPRMYLEARVTV
ncbi:AimR family lysis-lysogeny pheromone receptor [Thermaerobacillus caldiproteolyticus]|uniref:AimR family lysis-lysogeny pheromone receptor n=1 Tax=Thermaerobacillus caldiproteolyticus TaxID=247480 RepID=UPI00188B8399|nr:AimR family lysis-lysogeny pheromone receptor [Anoxybacillus caldiproteolyticus]QPA33396.1 helix-turn-helix transcriptional regulator [Anoxybacillus caldiproteolyticus]